MRTHYNPSRSSQQADSGSELAPTLQIRDNPWSRMHPKGPDPIILPRFMRPCFLSPPTRPRFLPRPSGPTPSSFWQPVIPPLAPF